MTPLLSTDFSAKGVDVWLKQEELNHPQIQGNKLHKLKLNIEAALAQQKTTLVTFGGAFSNHIAATAVAAKQAGLKSIGIIRGQELADHPEKWSHTLQEAKANGMHFDFISRSDYRHKADEQHLAELQDRYPNSYIIPEGGSNRLAIQGFESLMNQVEQQRPDWTHLFTAVGTGGTLAGIISYAKVDKLRHIFGVPVLKQGGYLIPQIENWLDNRAVNHWKLLTEYHAGGYAKTTPELLERVRKFEEEFVIDLDPVYTAKMVMAFYDQLERNLIPPGSKIILLHTGGLQGRKPITTKKEPN